MLAMEHDRSESNVTRAEDRPVRVLACSGSLDGGGSERQLWQLVSRLDRHRFAPQVYLLNKRGPYLDKLPVDVPVHAFDVDCPAPRTFPPGKVSRLQGQHLRRVLQAQQIDVVYDRTFHMSLLTGWSLPSHQPRVSVIVSPPSRDLPASERRFVWLKRWMLARAYRTATQTICVSHEVAEDAARYYGVPRDQLLVMHNPVDVESVKQLASAQCQSVSLPIQEASASPELHIAVVGRFTAEKGHRFAIEVLHALAHRPDHTAKVHLHLVGDGPLRSEIQTLIAETGLTPFVHMHGYQANPYPIMKACGLVWVPSRYEGFPNVALEAMALGVPLLMTDYGPTARWLAGDNNQRANLIGLDDVERAGNCSKSSWRSLGRGKRGRR